MGVVNTKSALLTNADANPATLNAGAIDGGKYRLKIGSVEVAAADDDTSVYRFCRVKSTVVIDSVKVTCDAITNGTDYDFGIYEVDDGAAVDINLFGDAVDLSSALVNTELFYESGDIDEADVGKQLWELLGLSEDPHKEYDIAATGVTVGSGAGTITLRTFYTDNS